MYEEFHVEKGDFIPSDVRADLDELLQRHFCETDDGELGRDYFCRMGGGYGLTYFQQFRDSHGHKADILIEVSESGNYKHINLTVMPL